LEPRVTSLRRYRHVTSFSRLQIEVYNERVSVTHDKTTKPMS